jgi:hypothetical protein
MADLVQQVRVHIESAFADARKRFEPDTPDADVWSVVRVLEGWDGEGPIGDPRGLPFTPGALALTRWSRVDLSVTEHLPELGRIWLRDCTGVDLRQLGACPKLTAIELNRCDTTSLEPLVGRGLRRIAVWSCPLERRWYDWLREQWANGTSGERPKTFPESTWRLGRKLYERGFVELVAFVSARGEDRISLAGKDAEAAGFAQLPEDEVDAILDRYPDATSAEMLQHLRRRFHELVPQIQLVPR